MMINKKILLTAFILGTVALQLSNFVNAEPIVELAAPRMPGPKIFADDGGTTLKPQATDEKAAPVTKTSDKGKNGKQTVKKSGKKSKKHVCQKPNPIVINYDKVSKLIEYGYYDEADRILEGAIDRNPSDIRARSLRVISLAKQNKLDPAQDDLTYLFGKYPDNFSANIVVKTTVKSKSKKKKNAKVKSAPRVDYTSVLASISNLHYAQGIVDYQRTTSSNMVYRGNSQKLLNDALGEFLKAISLDKNNARAYNAAGVISIRLGKDKDAIDYFNKAITVDKTYSLAIDNLGTIDFSNGKLDDAEKKFKESLKYNTQNTTAMYHLAQIAIQKQDYATALKYLNDALYINSDSPAIYNLMGKAYLAQGNEAAAINAFRQSVVAKPEFTLSYLDLANIYARRGDCEFAIEQLKTAISIDPDYYDAKMKLADLSLESGKYKQAIDVYSELVGVDGYNDFALKGLANAYYGQAQICSSKASIGSSKELYKALDYINKALSATPYDLELHLAKLKLSKLTNQPEQSKIELNKIVQSTSTGLTSSIVKGEAYITMNDYQNAQKAFDSAIPFSTNPDEDTYLSEILLYNKQYDSANKVLQKILKYDPNNQEALNNIDYIQKCKKYADNYFNSAKYFMKNGNQASAIEYFNRTLNVTPNNAQAHLYMAQIYEKKKDYDNALKNYKAFLNIQPNSPDTKTVKRKIKQFESKL